MSLCLNLSNRASFLHRGIAFFYTVAALLFVIWHQRFLQDYCATVNETYSSFSCLVEWGFVSSGLLNHWRGHTLKKKHAPSSCWFCGDLKSLLGEINRKQREEIEGYVLVGLSSLSSTTSPERRHAPFHKASLSSGGLSQQCNPAQIWEICTRVKLTTSLWKTRYRG